MEGGRNYPEATAEDYLWDDIHRDERDREESDMDELKPLPKPALDAVVTVVKALDLLEGIYEVGSLDASGNWQPVIVIEDDGVMKLAIRRLLS